MVCYVSVFRFLCSSKWRDAGAETRLPEEAAGAGAGEYPRGDGDRRCGPWERSEKTWEVEKEDK